MSYYMQKYLEQSMEYSNAITKIVTEHLLRVKQQIVS